MGRLPPDVTMLHPQDGVLSKTGFHALAWRLILGHRPRTRASPPRSRPFKYWLKLGFIRFGGPTGQTAIMLQEPGEKRRRISERCYLHVLKHCVPLPDPKANQ